MSRDRALAIGLAAGAVADAMYGDPSRRHPVAGFGAAMQRMEHQIYADSRVRGTMFAAGGVAMAAGPVGLVAAAATGMAAAAAVATR
jgi:adenosylcobinamide-phosphate synthase